MNLGDWLCSLAFMRHTVAQCAEVVAAGGCELVRASGPLLFLLH